jgi:hypothetical protein
MLKMPGIVNDIETRIDDAVHVFRTWVRDRYKSGVGDDTIPRAKRDCALADVFGSLSRSPHENIRMARLGETSIIRPHA